MELTEPSCGLLSSPTDGNNLRIQMTPSLDKPTIFMADVFICNIFNIIPTVKFFSSKKYQICNQHFFIMTTESLELVCINKLNILQIRHSGYIEMILGLL